MCLSVQKRSIRQCSKKTDISPKASNDVVFSPRSSINSILFEKNIVLFEKNPNMYRTRPGYINLHVQQCNREIRVVGRFETAKSTVYTYMTNIWIESGMRQH